MDTGQDFDRRRTRGFTLVEMLVTIAVIGILASLGFFYGMHARARGRAVTCLNNQRQISTALVGHYTDHGSFPTDGPDCNLAVALHDYIRWPESARTFAIPEVWRCPNDDSDKLVNSYQPFYVRRREVEDASHFVLGCPRHADADGSEYINLEGIDSFSQLSGGYTTINGEEIALNSSSSERTATSGTIEFEDGSTATIEKSGSGYGLTVVASYRNNEGTLYTIVRVTGEGEADFDVTPGSHFEVVTPVAIIGVKGTRFTVESESKYARVSLDEGRIWLWDRMDGTLRELSEGDEYEAGTGSVTTAYEMLELDFKRPGEWKVYNTNDFCVNFTWWDNNGESGSGLVCGNSWQKIYTHEDIWEETVTIKYSLPDANDLTASQSYSGAPPTLP